LTNNKKNQEIMPDEKKKMPLANAASKAVKASSAKPSMGKQPMPTRKTSATIQRIDKMSDGTIKKGPKKQMEMKSISEKEFYSSGMKRNASEGKSEPMQRRMK
jgi:hypothetical protein